MGGRIWFVSVTLASVVISTVAEKSPPGDAQTNEANDNEVPSDKELNGRVNRTILDTLEFGVLTALDKIGEDAVNVVKEVQAKAIQFGEKVLEIDVKLRSDLDEVKRIQNELNDSAEQVDELKNEVLSLEEKHKASLQTLNNKTADLLAAKQKLTEIMEEIQKVKEDCSSKCKRSITIRDRRLADVKLKKMESNSFLKSPQSRIIRALLDDDTQHQRQKRGRIREWFEERREGVKERVEEGREWVREKAREVAERARELAARVVVEKAREVAERVKERIRSGKRDVSTSALCDNNEACKALLQAVTTEMKSLEAKIEELQREVDNTRQATEDAKDSLDAAIKAFTDLNESVNRLSKALDEAENTVDDTNTKLEEARDAFDQAEKVLADTKERERLGLEIESKIAEAGPDGVIHIKSLSYNVKEAEANVGDFDGIMVASFFDGPEQSFSMKVTLALIESMVNDLVERVKQSIVI